MYLFIQKILNILFPVFCVGCRTKNTPLCEKCILSIPPPEQNKLRTEIISIFSYKNDITRKAIAFLKYKNNKEVGKILALSLYDIVLEELTEQNIFSNFSNPILIPIPLSKKRLKERGFNQSEVIAREMSFIDKGSSFTLATNVLYKTKNTPSQVSIKDKKKRLQNLHGCFSVKTPNKIKDANIILIDDVATTGATIEEARKTLLKSGAKKVIAFTIAH